MGLTVLLGAPTKYNYEAPGGGGGGACLGASLGPQGGASLTPPEGASNSLAPALVAVVLCSWPKIPSWFDNDGHKQWRPQRMTTKEITVAVLVMICGRHSISCGHHCLRFGRHGLWLSLFVAITVCPDRPSSVQA